ncbi:MAG: 4Fe-4S binding protein [Spirochaetes bacterium]|nr:4Fe-4S binding protein [Spirochaetota bacterium]
MTKKSKKENIIICSNSGCFSSGGVEVFIAFLDQIFNDPDLCSQYEVKKGGCHGFCEVGPTAIIGNDKIFYIQLTPEKVETIVEKHLKKGEVVEKYLYYDVINQKKVYSYDNIPFIKHQQRLILKDSPFIDPESFSDYQSSGGFTALNKILKETDTKSICQTILDSGLRGRGGGGYYTGEKWLKFSEQISQPKYIICNGDEGDPGTFMDRSLLEGDPFRVLEGMIIAGYATMATNGIIYLRKEYSLAIQRLNLALEKCYQQKILGQSVFNSPFSFDIKLEIGHGAYICGEETALLASIESQRGNPRVKPPFPLEKGLFNSPTLINNVETFANIVDIITQGCEVYSAIGTEESKGTKIFTLSGNIKNSGLVEVPLGVNFQHIIETIGGGYQGRTQLKAIQIGGASGSILPAEFITEEVSYENLIKIGTSMGAGGIVILDNDTCMVEIARYYTAFAQEESCGFCVPCREGTQKIIGILDRIIRGKGLDYDIVKIKTIAQVMYETSMCGLGKEAINPVMSLIKYFENELKEHIFQKKCRAGVCARLVRYYILEKKCIGCGACKLRCPVDAISGIKNQKHAIDGSLCIKCGQCYKICPVQAIERG